LLQAAVAVGVEMLVTLVVEVQEVFLPLHHNH
jgi:hypothetical protein